MKPASAMIKPMDPHDPHLFGRLNVSEIDDRIYIGSRICCTEHFIEVWPDASHLAVISLEDGRDDPDVQPAFYRRIPIADGEAPTMELFDEISSLIDEQLSEERTLFIHCTNGYGRAATILAAYYVYKGMNVEEAVAKIKGSRPDIFINGTQFAALYDYVNYRKNGFQ